MLFACLDGVPPLRTYNYMGVIIPKLHFSEDLVIDCIKQLVNSLRVNFYLSADAFDTVCYIISLVMVSFHACPDY